MVSTISVSSHDSIREKCALVLDRAIYHTILTNGTKSPTTTWKKGKLVYAIERWGLPPWSGQGTGEWKNRASIARIRANDKTCIKIFGARTRRFFQDKYVSLQNSISSSAAPEVNLIKIVCGIIERKRATKNLHFKLSDIENIIRCEVESIVPNLFKKLCLHAMREEDKYCSAIHCRAMVTDRSESTHTVPVLEGSSRYPPCRLVAELRSTIFRSGW